MDIQWKFQETKNISDGKTTTFGDLTRLVLPASAASPHQAGCASGISNILAKLGGTPSTVFMDWGMKHGDMKHEGLMAFLFRD